MVNPGLESMEWREVRGPTEEQLVRCMRAGLSLRLWRPQLHAIGPISANKHRVKDDCIERYSIFTVFIVPHLLT